MKKHWRKREYILVGIVVLLFALVSCFSLFSIYQMRGNARIVNYTGIVRGATQRLIKKELQKQPDDALIARLDSIVSDLVNGGGPNDLIAFPDEKFQDNMKQIQEKWAEIKKQIQIVRDNGETETLYELSEDYFFLADKTVTAAEVYSEEQVDRSTRLLIGVDTVFFLLICVSVGMFIHSAKLEREASTLGKLAYVDVLTQMPNRASCEREINRYLREKPDAPAAVYMFDLNGLKQVNEMLGHQGGDKMIADFARILQEEGTGYGFVGRYGGDEFIGIFADCDENAVDRYLQQVNRKVDAYNRLHGQEIEKIRFAVGCVLESPAKKSMLAIIHEADQKMYQCKRAMQEQMQV